MTDRLFFDTNILIYAIDRNEPEKRYVAVEWLRQARLAAGLVINPQVLNECYSVAKSKMPAVPRSEVREFLRSMFEFCWAPLDRRTTEIAWSLQDALDYSWWDCLLLASALQSECSTFVSEDLVTGQSVGGLTIINPFSPRSASLLPKG
jgi:predicted nucleic acid-binding protein